MITTEPMIQALISEKVKLDYFTEHNVSVDFIKPRVYTSIDHSDKTKEETARIVPFIYPKRNTFLKFLTYLQKKYPNRLEDLFSMEIRASEVVLVSEQRTIYRDSEQYIEDKEIDKLLPCGHSDKFAGYCDSDKCMICDINNFKKEILKWN